MRRIAFTIDLVIVLVFVVAGRETHQESQFIADVAETAAPFAIGLLVAWALPSVRGRHRSLAAAAQITGVTVIVGMVLRRTLFSDGTAAPFVIVATLFLAAGFFGWRALTSAVERRKAVGVG